MGCCCSKKKEEEVQSSSVVTGAVKGILKPTRTFSSKEESPRKPATLKPKKVFGWKDSIDSKKVLSFWFTEVAYFSERPKRETMRTREYSSKMSAELWYSGSKEADEKCTSALRAEVIVAQKEKLSEAQLAKNAFSRSDNRLDAILARVILLDQISRNVFRGTEKAFVGDECALRYSKFIVRERLGDDLPPAALGFIVSPFLHSELVEDHVLAEKFCRRMIEKNGANTPLEWTLKYVLGHKEVLEMFGRYPHRNEILGRETTVEEARWLVSAQVPQWAKSQRRKKLDE